MLAPLAQRDYRVLWVAQVCSELGDWAARLGLSALVLQRTGSAAVATLVLAASLLPWVGFGQVLAAWSERFGRKKVMVVSDVFRGSVFLVMLLPLPVTLLVALAFLAGLATPPFAAARSSAMVELVPPDQLGAASALSGITNDLAMVLGYAVAGGLIGVAGPEGALAVNAVTFILSGLLLLLLPTLRAAGARGTMSGLRSGRDALWHDRLVRRAVLLVMVSAFAVTALESLAVVYGERVLDGRAWIAGPALAGAALLSIVVTLRVPHYGSSRLLRWCAGTCLLGGLVPLGCFAFLGTGVWGVSAFVAAGLLLVVIVPANVLVGPRLPVSCRAAAFSLLMGTLVASQASGAAVAGGLAELLGVTSAGMILASLPVLAGALSLLRPVPDEGPATALPAQEGPKEAALLEEDLQEDPA